MKVAIFISFVLAAISWQIVSAEQTFIIGAEEADCHGLVPMKCLQVKDGPSASWRNLFDHIEGFDYEKGYEYVLKVKDEEVENPPADGSSVKYTLVEQVSKTKV